MATPDTEALRSDGIEMYGLYVEAVEVSKLNENPRRYWRYFLVGEHLYLYARDVNKKATTWRRLKFPTTEDARTKLLNSLAGNSSVKFILRGEPVLTQLRPSDVIAIAADQVPPARYTGQGRVDAAIGKFDLEAWKPVAS
jgi:hypothetical protein